MVIGDEREPELETGNGHTSCIMWSTCTCGSCLDLRDEHRVSLLRENFSWVYRSPFTKKAIRLWHADIRRVDFQTATASSCGSEIYCAWSSKGHRKSGVISIKHSRDITNGISHLEWNHICFLPHYTYLP